MGGEGGGQGHHNQRKGWISKLLLHKKSLTTVQMVAAWLRKWRWELKIKASYAPCVGMQLLTRPESASQGGITHLKRVQNFKLLLKLFFIVFAQFARFI